jgi:poly [ADP-ribose] polymerase 2/3/4
VHAAAQEEGKLASKKQKPDNETKERGQNVPSKNKKSADNEGKDGEPEAPTKSKKLKAEESEPNGREAAAREFAEFCKAIGERLSLEDMRKILQANEQDASGLEDAVVPRWY